MPGTEPDQRPLILHLRHAVAGSSGNPPATRTAPFTTHCGHKRNRTDHIEHYTIMVPLRLNLYGTIPLNNERDDR